MQLSWDQARALGIKLPTVSKPKRAKKPSPPDSYVPHDCVILAIDPGNLSGWALIAKTDGSWRIYSGQTAQAQAMIVAYAKRFAQKVKQPLIVVGETWTTGDRVHDRRMRAATLLGLGAAWECWRLAFEDAGLAKGRVVRVNTATWRAKVLGGPMNRTTAEWKRAALRHAQHGERMTIARAPIQDLLGSASIMGDDEADAICIGFWARHAGAVGEAVRKAGKRYP